MEDTHKSFCLIILYQLKSIIYENKNPNKALYSILQVKKEYFVVYWEFKIIYICSFTFAKPYLCCISMHRE